MEAPKQSFIEDLSWREIRAIEKRMRPGRYSYEGFLGGEQGFFRRKEKLRDVIERDAQLLEKYGITHKQVGDKLESLIGQAFRQWNLAERAGQDYYAARENRGALIDGFLRVTAIGWMGSQFCPWFGDEHGTYCGEGSHDFTVYNLKQKSKIEFPQLMAHLVRDHHFFEGNTPYRLNPEDAIKLLELKPSMDYTPKTETETVWRMNIFTLPPREIERLKKSAEKVPDAAMDRELSKYSLDENATLEVYLAGDKGLLIANCPNFIFLKRPLRIDGVEFTGGTRIYSGVCLIEKVKNTYISG